MTLDEARAFYDSDEELAAALGIGRSAISMWRARGGRIPTVHQYRLERLTNGKLIASDIELAEDDEYE